MDFIRLDSCKLRNYAIFLFQQKELDEAFTLYETTYASCLNKKDYFRAGLASYHAGLIQMQFEDKSKASALMKQALDAWDQLDERPTQYAEVSSLLETLE